MVCYQVQHQRTAGAYRVVTAFKSREKAVLYLKGIASKTPSFPYNGEDSWKDSNNIHCVNRYRIVKISID